jgi:hypothetical protein
MGLLAQGRVQLVAAGVFLSTGPAAAWSFRQAAGDVLACVLTLAQTIESG